MEKTCVFLDGGYLDHIVQDINKKLNFLKLAQKLCGAGTLIRVYYYHCLPYKSHPPTTEEKTRFIKASSFFDRFKQLDRFEVRLGKLVKRGEYPNGSPILIQKRVDVYLATDLVKFSAQKAMDLGIILTSDSDYVPAIQAAKEFGVIIKLAYYSSLSINRELLETCDENFRFGSSFCDNITRI